MIKNKIKIRWFKLNKTYRYCIIGAVNACVMYFMYLFFVLLFGKRNYQLSLALAWLFSSVSSYLTHKFFVFFTKGKIFTEYLKCCTTWFFSYLINAFLLELFVAYLGFNVFISQVIAPIIAGIFTYLMFCIIFKRNKNFNLKTNAR